MVWPVPPLATGRVPVTLVVRLQKVVEVDPVPPFAVGRAVPERVTANVPVVVIGEPDTDRNEGTDIATEVTEPPLPVAEMLMPPALFVIDTPEPAVSVALVSVLPVVLPISN